MMLIPQKVYIPGYYSTFTAKREELPEKNRKKKAPCLEKRGFPGKYRSGALHIVLIEIPGPADQLHRMIPFLPEESDQNPN